MVLAGGGNDARGWPVCEGPASVVEAMGVLIVVMLALKMNCDDTGGFSGMVVTLVKVVVLAVVVVLVIMGWY